MNPRVGEILSFGVTAQGGKLDFVLPKVYTTQIVEDNIHIVLILFLTWCHTIGLCCNILFMFSSMADICLTFREGPGILQSIFIPIFKDFQGKNLLNWPEIKFIHL